VVRITTEQQVSSSIYAPLGARVSFNLPDGTTGMLNSGSHLSYSLPFTNNRQVKLEGEAWLEVKRDENHPFEISTGNSTVKVLGTSFNMSAYPAENYVEVVLQQGKVEFLDNKGDEKVTMLPSERLVFKNGNISKSVTDPAKYNAWTEGKLVFRGDPVAEVARRIERWYNVKVELADLELEKYSFRATFEDDKLEEVLRLLSMTSPIRYQITPRMLLADGTYEKEKVTICLKKR
jgi:transmembrane sensor